MKMSLFKPILLCVLALLVISCNVDNPRIRKVNIRGNLQNLGGFTLEEFYSELEKFSDETPLPLGTTAEGEFRAMTTQNLNFNSGAIACRFSFERASFKITVDQDLALGQAIKTEITPIAPVNKTVGTSAARELCESDLATAGIKITTSTLVATTERTLAAKNMISSLKELQQLCQNRDTLPNGERCEGINYSITRANFYSAGPAIASFKLELDLRTLQGNRRIELTFIPSSTAILTGGVLSLESEADLWSINAGSLGTVSDLELANLK